LSLGSAGALQAHPLDSPDIVYIDGMPCNSACQSYMAWSRQTTPVSGQPQPRSASAGARQRPRKSLANRAIASKLATSVRATKQSPSKSPEIPRKKNMDLPTAGKAGASFDTPVANDAGALPRVAIRQQLTRATVDPKESEQKTASDHSEAVLPSDSQPNEPLLSNDTDPRIAILMARPEIKSVSDLAGKNIAIENTLSASVGVVQIAIAAAAAAGVQLAASPTKALDRVIDGQVSAAVLMLAYPEAAETFPEIAGFNIFRIPLTPERSRVKRTPITNATSASDPATARTGDLRPTDDVATGSHTRKTQELITAAIAVVERMTTAATADPQGNSEPRSNDADPRIAILMARPEIKSLSDLAGKKIAIDDKQSSSTTNVRTAIASVAGVQVSERQTEAIDQLISGEVSAAVLSSGSREAAEAFPEIAGFNIFRIPLMPEPSGVKRTDLPPNADATAAWDIARAKVADSRATDAVATGSHTRTTQELVTAATAVAERMTTPMADLQGTAPAPSNDTDPRIAILMARPEIKSVSDLAGKEVAIDDKQFSNSNVGTTIAGVAGVEVSEGKAKAIDRVIGGEVPAAVLTFVSREAAEAFPQIAGFNILRIPLSSEMPRAGISGLLPASKTAAASDAAGARIPAVQPGRAVAPDFHTGTIQELVTAATTVAERMTTAMADLKGPEQKTNSSALPGEAQKTTPAPSGDGDPRVVILMARPGIKLISDLAGKEIAIDDKQSPSSGKVRTAIAAAGAAEVHVSQSQTKPIYRLIFAEVTAAVLTLVSPEAAEGFPEVAGFRIFRIPLSPRSVAVGHP
jgi:TRAP-type uncharacterized transport system substrate-binding protein